MTITQSIGMALMGVSFLIAAVFSIAMSVCYKRAATYRQPWASWWNVMYSRFFAAWSAEAGRREESYFTEQAVPYLRRGRHCEIAAMVCVLTYILGAAIAAWGISA